MPLNRLTYDRIAKAVPHRSDKSEGRTAATDSADPPEFTARTRVVHSSALRTVTASASGATAASIASMRSSRAQRRLRDAGPPRLWTHAGHLPEVIA